MRQTGRQTDQLWEGKQAVGQALRGKMA